MTKGEFFEFELPPTTCPTCLHHLNGTMTQSEDRGPADGDFTVCIRCGAIGIYDAKLQLRHPTDDELKTALADPDVAAYRRHVHLMNGAGA